MKNIIFILLLTCLACSQPSETPGKNERDRLVVAYTEMLKTKAKSPVLPEAISDSSVKDIKEQLITHADYKLAIEYLNEEPGRWNDFFKEAKKLLSPPKAAADSSGTALKPPVPIR